MIPSIKECYAFMDQYHMLNHIKAHSVVVARIARMMAHELQEVNPGISVLKTTVGALLHDIGKTPSLDSGGNHAELGAQICIENGFTEIAPIVAEHVILKNYHLSDVTSEKEVVFYADKRVNHDRIVTLEERETYIIDRYGLDQEELCRKIRSNFNLCSQVEEKLFRKLKFSPESLLRMDGAEKESFEKGLEMPDDY
ncbi:MAG: HD domain-containing protein [Deltaproteobacteria bacterium]|nr:HD domain-containing protein [Deltaproteobacteria bacterium]